MTVQTFRMLIALAGVAGMVYSQSVSAEDAVAPANPCPTVEGKRPGRGNPVEMLTKKLNLTADQQAQVKAIFDEMHPQMKAVWENQTLSKEDKATKSKELHTATNVKVRALLTADQQKAFDELKQKRPHGGPGGHQKAPPAQ